MAKDGADLPPSQAVEAEAIREYGTGETCDFVYTPRVGERLHLEITRPDIRLPGAPRRPRPPIRMDFKVVAEQAGLKK